MTAVASRRVQKELRDLNAAPVAGVEVTPKDDNILEWTGTVAGPAGTPYEGGTFHFKIVFPETYPFKAPEVNFTTKIYHPGFDEEGHVCLPVLRDQWKPATSMTSLLDTIQKKIGNPDPDDPYDTDIAAVLKTDEKKFNATAKEWVKKYAK